MNGKGVYLGILGVHFCEGLGLVFIAENEVGTVSDFLNPVVKVLDHESGGKGEADFCVVVCTEVLDEVDDHVVLFDDEVSFDEKYVDLGEIRLKLL